MINPINGTDKTKLNMDNNNQSDKQPNQKNDKVVVFDDILKESIEELDRSTATLTAVDLTHEFMAKVDELEANKLEE